MGFWRSKSETMVPLALRPQGIASAALACVTLHQLCGEVYSALSETLSQHHIESFGVWLSPQAEGREVRGLGSFQGRFWNFGREDAPPEWNVVAPHWSVPQHLFAGGPSVQQDVDPDQAPFVLGPAAGMRRLLWVPVRAAQPLDGLLFAATRRAHGPLPRAAMEAVATQLALALGFLCVTAASKAECQDLAFVKQVWAELTTDSSPDRVLQQIVNRSLTRGADRQRVASFAMIGVLPGKASPKSPSDEPLEFRWTAGDRLWARSAMSGPISALWQEALEKTKTVGQEVPTPGSLQEVVRIVAVPLLVNGEAAGVLVAGLRNASATLANLERLELHARLAAVALTLAARSQQGAGALESAKFFLDHAVEPSFLLNTRLEITSVSSSGKKLLSLFPQSASSRQGAAGSEVASYGTAAQLFRPQEWQRLVVWMRGISRNSAMGASHTLATELRTGKQVRLQAAPLPGQCLSLIVQSSEEQAASLEDRAARELQALIEWLDEGIVIFDHQENVRAANLRFSQLFGLSATDLEGTSSLRDLIGMTAPRVNDSAHFAERWWDAARNVDVGLREEIQILQPASRLLERISRPLLDSNGARAGRLEIYRDLTTQQLFHSKLRKNERLVSLGERVSSVVHELSNPLTTILGYAQRMFAKHDASFRRDDLQRIFSEAERASSILRELLGSTRESVSDFRPVELNPLILRTAELHRFQLASEKIRIELDLAPSLPAILGDEGQLQQILVNLIANSRHALLELQRPGTISFDTSLSDTGRVLLEVSDTGPGIPEALRHRIFDPFFTTKPAGLGTGLGLSIVSGLVRQHGGHIRLDTSAGHGATFLIDFPPASGEVPLLLRELPPALSTPPPVARGERVLVVEDEPTVAQLIADMLSDLGFSSDVQRDPRLALAAALNRDYALVVCDMKMPGLDGQQFYRALAETGSPLISRFLFVTGDVLAAGTQEFLRQHRLPHIAKPFRVEEFTGKIALVLAEPAADSASSHGLSRKNLMSHG